MSTTRFSGAAHSAARPTASFQPNEWPASVLAAWGLSLIGGLSAVFLSSVVSLLFGLLVATICIGGSIGIMSMSAGLFRSRSAGSEEATGKLAAIDRAQAVAEFDLDGTVITANEKFLAITGYRLDEVQGRHHSQFAEQAYANSAEYKQFWDKLNRGETVTGEFKQIGKNNSEVWVQAWYNPVLDDQGRPVKVVSGIIDITTQKRAVTEISRVLGEVAQGDLSGRIDTKFEGEFETIREDLNDSLARLHERELTDGKIAAENGRIRQALDRCQTNVMVADADYNIVYMNDTMHEMMRNAESDLRKELPQLDANNLMGRNIDIFHKNPAHQRAMLDSLGSVHKTRITVSNRTFSLIASPIFDENQQRLGTVVEWEDMTEKLAAQEKADRTAQENFRIRQALDKCQTNVMVADKNYDIVYMNETLTDMMSESERDIRKDIPRFDANSLIGTNIDTFHKNPAHQRRMLDNLTSTYETDLEIAGLNFHLVVSPVVGEDGSRIGTVVEWKDETAEKAIEKEVDGIVSAALGGDFSRRASLEDKQGFMRRLAESLNSLCETVQGAVEDIGVMFGALAQGNLTQRIDRDYQGALGKLKTDGNATAERLSATVAEIMSAATEVANAAAEISTGTSDLSQRTEQQASSLEETAASMEELSTTVKQNAENAQHANQLSESARDAAEQGGNVVSNAVTAMSRISESSDKIAEIIGVIDGIAFQTNLLALNAAVEAARAGEAGRGFAVVASEVRTLAQRSSEAAKDIKELITQRTGQVKDGVDLVNKTGNALEEIVESIKRVTDIVAEIAAASNEQAKGIEEVNTAVSQMDEMTQQNSALVEENAAAAKTLQDQSETMNGQVSFFTLDKMAKAEPRQAGAVSKPVSQPAAARPVGGSAKQMQTALAVAIDDDPDWKEF